MTLERLERLGRSKVARGPTDSQILKNEIFVKIKKMKNQQKSQKFPKCVWAYDLPVFCPAEAVEIVKIIKIIKFN